MLLLIVSAALLTFALLGGLADWLWPPERQDSWRRNHVSRRWP